MQKTSGNVFLVYIGERIFHIFPKMNSIIGGFSPIPFRIFLNYVTILNSSPMQHLRLCYLRQKVGNDWKLLTVLTQNFVLNVTGFQYLTLKRTDKFRLRQQSIPSSIHKFTFERHLVFLLLPLNICHTLFYCYYCSVRTNICWLSLRNYSFRK